LPDFRLEFRTELGTLKRTTVEEFSELRIFHVFGCRQKPVFTIAARFDQVIETLNEFLTIDSHDYPPRTFMQLPCQFPNAPFGVEATAISRPPCHRELSERRFFPLEGVLQEVFAMEGLWQPVKSAITNTIKPSRFRWPDQRTRLTASSAPYTRWLPSVIIARAESSAMVSREKQERCSVQHIAQKWKVSLM
jgi:hypothetical protein